MLKQFALLLFVFTSAIVSGQDITATVKTVNAVAPGKEFTVEILVNKPGVNGFMKYFQDLPLGYVATDVDSKGGNFTFADNGAKVIWISPPNVDQFTLIYKIAVPADAVGSISIGGKISYVVGNERKALDIEGQVVAIGKGGAATPAPVKTETPVVKQSTPPPAESKPVVITETSKPAAAEEKPKPAEEKPKPVEPKKETPVVAAAPSKAPATASAIVPGRTYRVQIGAFSQKPQIDGVPEPTTLLLDNGMTKYFSGNFKTYEEASRRKKEMLERGFQGAFIVAFENGKIVK